MPLRHRRNPFIGGALALAVLILTISPALSPLILPRSVTAGATVVNSGIVGMVLDPGRPRLYLLNDTTGSVDVLNTTSDRVIARVHVGSGLHGLDVSQDDSQLYVTLRGTNQLGIVALATLTVLKPINLTATPGDVAAGRQGRAYVSHQFDFLFSQVDTLAGKELGTISTSETGGTVRVSPDRKNLYIGYQGVTPCIIDKYGVSTDTIQSLGSPPWGSIGGNFGDMAVDPDNVHLYVMCAYPYVAQWLNTTNWALSGTLPTGPYPSAIGLAPAVRLAFTAQGSSGIDAFNTTTRALLQTYQATGSVLRIVALPDGSKFYAITSGGRVESFNLPRWPLNSKLTAISKSPTIISLAWTSAGTTTAISGYEITGGRTPIIVPATTLNYNVTQLNPSTNYTFTIYLLSYAGDLSLSGPTASAVTLPDTIPPSWPQGSNVNASNVTPISLTLTWTRATDDVGVTNYRIYANTTFLVILGNVTSTILTGLQPNKTYNFQILASDLSNNTSTGGPRTTVHTPSQSSLPGPYGIVYVPIFPSAASPGSQVTLTSGVSNTGSSQIKILSITILGVGAVYTQNNLPLILQPGTHVLLNISATIRSDMYPDSYSLTTSVAWQYLDPVTDTWLAGSPDPIVVNPVILITSHPFLPGVSVGTTATYSITLSSYPQAPISVTLTVTDVSGPIVSYTQKFYVGSTLANTTLGSVNVVTGAYTGPVYVPFAFVASGLSIGYPLYSGLPSLPISSVSNMVLAGSTRSVFSATTGPASTSTVQFNATWDSSTGLLGALDATIPGNVTSVTAHYILVSTNAWITTVTFTQSATTIGLFSSVTFNAQVSGGIPPYSYRWDYGDGATSSQSSATHTYLRPGTFRVVLRVTDSAGSSQTATSTVAVSPSPNPLQTLDTILQQPNLLRTVLIALGIYATFTLAISYLVIRRDRLKQRRLVLQPT